MLDDSMKSIRHERQSGWFSKSRGLSASVSFLPSPPPPPLLSFFMRQFFEPPWKRLLHRLLLVCLRYLCIILDTKYALFHTRLLLFWQLDQTRSHKSQLNETQVDFKSSPDSAGYPVLILIVILKRRVSATGQFLFSLEENYGAVVPQQRTIL